MRPLLGSVSVSGLFLMLMVAGCGDRAVPGQPASTDGGTPPVVTPATPEVTCAVSATPIQPANGHFLAIADAGNNRVLLYRAPFCTGQGASAVLGQPDFSSNAANQGQGKVTPAANTLYASNPVSAMAMDAKGNLWVTDVGNCRVLEFRPPFTTNMSASLVIGQSQFTTGGPCAQQPAGPNNVQFPSGVAIDPQGNLWVADAWTNRITEYVPPFSNGMAASLVIGYSSLSGSSSSNCAAGKMGSPVSQSALCQPGSITFDSRGDLWVADAADFRVLEFAPPFHTGMAASLVLGQPSAASTAVGQASALSFDAAGNLWVADQWNYRVAEFVPPFTSGMAASLVLGQSSFALLNPANIDYTQPSADILNAPSGLTFDSQGNLIVPTLANSRALIFEPPFSTGMAASMALGQIDLTSGSYDGCPAAANNTLCQPAGALSF